MKKKAFHFYCFAALIGVAALAGPELASAQDSVATLGKLRLAMPLELIEHRFGQPLQTAESGGGGSHRVYPVDPEINGYAVVQHSKDWPDHAVAIQYAGEGPIEGVSLHGLQLGARPERIKEVLGEPTTISPAGHEDWSLWTYAARNYSVEVSPTFGMTSILISGFKGFWASLGLAESYETYYPGSLETELEAVRVAFQKDPPTWNLNMAPRRILVVSTGEPSVRETLPEESKFLQHWATARGFKSLPEYGFVTTVKEGGKDFPILLQSSFTPAWQSEVEAGQIVLLFAMVLGTYGDRMKPVIVANEFQTLPWKEE